MRTRIIILNLQTAEKMKKGFERGTCFLLLNTPNKNKLSPKFLALMRWMSAQMLKMLQAMDKNAMAAQPGCKNWGKWRPVSGMTGDLEMHHGICCSSSQRPRSWGWPHNHLLPMEWPDKQSYAGNSAGDLFGMFKWPFQRLSNLQG